MMFSSLLPIRSLEKEIKRKRAVSPCEDELNDVDSEIDFALIVQTSIVVKQEEIS